MEDDKNFKNIMDDDFGKIILKIRKEKNLTQKELADLINVSDRTISKWENSQSVPDLICIKNICKSLGISPSSLVLDKKSKKEHISAFHCKLKKIFNPKFIFQLIFITVFILLCIFYINNRNTVTIYKLKLNCDDFFVGKSYYIRTKYKNILVINDIHLNHKTEPSDIKIELYTLVNGDKEKIYERNSLENIYIDNFEGYSPRLTTDIFNSITKNLYINISFKQNNELVEYEGAFSINKEYYNNKLITEDIKNKENNATKLVMKNIDIRNDLLKLGYRYNGNRYIKNMGKVTVGVDIDNNIITMTNKRYLINYYCDKDFIQYFNFKNNQGFINYFYYIERDTYQFIKGKCEKNYSEINEVINIYQEIKDIL